VTSALTNVAINPLSAELMEPNTLLEQVFITMKELNHPQYCNIMNFSRQVKESTGITVRGHNAKNM
jgi:hypothetical protein